MDRKALPTLPYLANGLVISNESPKFFNDPRYFVAANTAKSLKDKARTFRKTIKIHHGYPSMALSAVDIVNDCLFFIFWDIFPECRRL